MTNDAGSAAEPAAGAADQARRSHVGLPSRGRGMRARGGSAASKTAGGMKLGASKLGASKLGNPEEFFDF